MENYKGIETLNNKLKDLVGTYHKLKRTIDQKEKDDLKELYLVRSGKSLEALVFYIVKKEKLTVMAKPQNGKINPDAEVTLDDYIFQLKKNNIIDKVIASDFYNIKNWRNKNSHYQDSEKSSNPGVIRDSTIESVYDSFKEILTWFFEQYLKGEYADFSKNLYVKPEQTKEPSKEELDEIKKNFEKNPLNIPDFSILSESKKAPKSKKNRKAFLYILLLAVISVLSYYLYTEHLDRHSNDAPIKTKTHLNKEQVLEIIRKYNDSYNDVKFDAHKYFANYVDHYITDPNINNPTEIEIARKTNIEYIDPKSTIDPETLVLVSSNDSVAFWRFKCENICYRTSKKLFEKCNVLMEYGINTEGKITRVKQISYSNLKRSKNRPN